MESLFPQGQREVAADAFHVPNWLSLAEQQDLVRSWRRWAIGPVPMRHVQLPTGKQMSVQTVCLGWQWVPYRYVRKVDGVEVATMPRRLAEVGKKAVQHVYGTPYDDYEPDTALVNFYDANAKMGMHQDKDEKGDAPVVSLSIGSTCVFRFGNSDSRNEPYQDIELESGDLFVFGGRSRFAYHGVVKLLPATDSPRTGLESGRINITMRMTGLAG